MNTIWNNNEVRVKITDVTLREWDQAPLTSFIKQEKAIIALMLNEIWVDTIEAWFAASEAEKENQNIAWAIEAVWEESNIVVSSLWMAVDWNTNDSLEALKNSKNSRIHIFIATPDDHINSKFEKQWKDIYERREFVLKSIINQINKVVEYNKENNVTIEIEVSPEAASNNAINNFKVLDFESEQFKFLVKWVREVIIAWANVINIPDTLGNLLPWEMEKLFTKLTEETNDLKWDYNFRFSCHVHNDIAWATIWALWAVRWWAEEIELTINWIWERTWNTPMHEIVWIINEKPFSIVDWKKVVLPKINTKLIWPVSRFVWRILNLNRDLQTPFIGWLSDVDWSWVHNAAQNVYWWTKNKAKYWWEEVEPFFSPRWWRNQICNILKEYWIEEDPKWEIISSVTKKACLKAETTKALYYSNIYAMYLEEIQEFEIKRKSIVFWDNHVEIKFNILWEEIIINWEWDWEQWFIDWTIKWINKFLWKDIVDIVTIKDINKASLKWEVEDFYDETMDNGIELSAHFHRKIIDILLWSNWNWKHSKQNWVSHIKMKVNWKKNTSVEYWHDVTKNNIIAIIYWALPEIYKHIKNKQTKNQKK